MKQNTFLLLLLLLTGVMNTAKAQPNMVLNGGFDGSIAQWDPFTGFGVEQRHDSLDAADDNQSGSLRGFLPAESTFRLPPAASQKFEVSGDRVYFFGGQIFIPSGQVAVGRAQLFVTSFDNPGCFGNSLPGSVTTALVFSDSDWTLTMADYRTAPEALCVRLWLRMIAPANEDLVVHFDDIFHEVMDDVFENGFE